MDSKSGLFLVISDDSELITTLVHIKPRGMEIRVWCPPKAGAHRTLLLETMNDLEANEAIVKGDLAKPAFYQAWKHFDPICVVLALKDTEEADEAREQILENLPDAKILSLILGNPSKYPRSLDNERELALTWTELLIRPLCAELRHIQAAHSVKAVRDVLDSGDKIALLLQPDPDPDGLASALALRSVLGRNKTSTPIVSFGKVTRPENMAMMRLLDIEVLTIRPEDLIHYDRVALLDTQPAHFNVTLPRVDVIIDHHPICAQYVAPYVDIRPKYGATSTILNEYLKAAAVSISERLATALLYGIKSDTLLLNREVIDADLDAFVSLYPHINNNLLRRIEKPELPMTFAPTLATALKNMVCESGILVSCLGPVEREDLIPQVADFLLQFEDVEWVASAGIFDGNIVVSVRNVGYVKNAGDVVKRIVNGWAYGGGHRTMAKAIFPLTAWKQRYKTTSPQGIRDIVLQFFVEEAL